MADQQAAETKLCSNCKRQIAASNFLMHETFCVRNVRPCEICKMPIDKNMKDEHFEEFHAKEKCVCGAEFEKSKIDKHKKDECPKREVNCKYCQMPLAIEKLDNHMDACGTRTEMCPSCNRYIKMKDQELHFTSNCKYPEPEKPKETNVLNPYRQIPNIRSEFHKPVETRAKVIQPNPPPPKSINVFDPTSGTSRTVETKRQNSGIKLPPIDNNEPIIVPCEVCSEPFAFDELVHHQSECSKNPDNSLLPQHTATNRVNDDNNMHEDFPYSLLNTTYNATNTNKIHNINIHDYDFGDYDDDSAGAAGAYGHDDDPRQYNVTHVDLKKRKSDNDIAGAGADVVPCEFCNELFPFDIIQIHQDGCRNSFDALDGLSHRLNELRNFDTDHRRENLNQFESLLNYRKPSDPSIVSNIKPTQSRTNATDEVLRNRLENTTRKTTKTTTPGAAGLPSSGSSRVIASGLSPVINDANRRTTTTTTTRSNDKSPTKRVHKPPSTTGKK